MPIDDGIRTVLRDLKDEQEALDQVVAGVQTAEWDLRTPSPEWFVRDPIAHLAFYDEQAAVATADPARFRAETESDRAHPDEFLSRSRSDRGLAPTALLDAWRRRRHKLMKALSAAPDDMRVPWYGPPMSLRSFITARLMETWAHGDDEAEGLRMAGHDVRYKASDRLAHICHLGVGTFGWSWVVRGESPPDTSVRVELVLPSGAMRTAGPQSTPDVVRGAALDFCHVVTQRRNVADTALDIVGPVAHAWMQRAQCFAGDPTEPPSPRARSAQLHRGQTDVH